MKLEASLKHFSPQGMHISDDVKGTSPDRLTGTDVMAAIGTTSSRARFGLAAFFGKAGISKTDEQLAVQALARYAMDVAPKNVRKAAGGQFGWCMQMLAQFAFADYSRSAATSVTCHSCSGTGFIFGNEDVVKHPGIFDADGAEVVAPKIKNELVKRVCGTCGGKKVILARCRCGGKGEVLDRKATKDRGA
ncbi:TPA: antitermination protein, partial [Enterobacter kobei]